MEGEGGILVHFNNLMAVPEPAMCLTYIQPRALRTQLIHWQERKRSSGGRPCPTVPTR